MPIIDSQVHAYEANTPKRPWHTVPNWPPHVTGDEMVAAMDRVGVDGAIFISAFSMYRYDASYAVEVQRSHPGRFGIVKPVDPDDPAVADVIAMSQLLIGLAGRGHAVRAIAPITPKVGSRPSCFRPIAEWRRGRLVRGPWFEPDAAEAADGRGRTASRPSKRA